MVGLGSGLVPAGIADRLDHLALLRRGGIGLLLRARHVDLDREVVLKLLAPSGDRVGAALLSEARIQASVADLAGVCEVLDAGVTEDGGAYLLTPYLPDGSLEDRVAEAPLAFDEAIGVLVSAATALAAVHARGVVHGDLKPSNLLIAADGRPLLTDFGCARQLDPDTTMSESGEHLGTILYAPPEQLAGQPASQAGDVYSLGLTFAALMFGRSPLTGPDEPLVATLERLLSGEGPDLGALSLPPVVERLVARMCASEPAARPSASEVVGELADAGWSDGGPRLVAGSHAAPAAPDGPPERARRAVRARAIAAAALLVVGAGALGYVSGSDTTDHQALAFCRGYGELSNAASYLVNGASQKLAIDATFATALTTVLNDLPGEYANAFARFSRRAGSYPPEIRSSLELAAGNVSRLEMADYLAHLDGRSVFDAERHARVDLLPSGLRQAAVAYVAVDQFAVRTCGLVESTFPAAKERLIRNVAAALSVDAGEFFQSPTTSNLVPVDFVDLAPHMAPKFVAAVIRSQPAWFVGMMASRPEVVTVLLSRHPDIAVQIVESAAAAGIHLGGAAWVQELQDDVTDPTLAGRLQAALGGG